MRHHHYLSAALNIDIDIHTINRMQTVLSDLNGKGNFD